MTVRHTTHFAVAIVVMSIGWAGESLAQSPTVVTSPSPSPVPTPLPGTPKPPITTLPASPLPGTATPAAMTLPTNWIGLGGAYDPSPSASPKSTGWGTYARLLSPSQGLYSFTTWDTSGVTLKGFKPGTVVQAVQQSMRTGMALAIRQIKGFTLLGLGDAGLATVGATTTEAFSGGGIGVYRFASGWTVELGVRVLKTPAGGTETIYEYGMGKTW